MNEQTNERANAEARFANWFEAQYPSQVIITNPSWHAPKIFRAVVNAIEEAKGERAFASTPLAPTRETTQ